MERLHTFRGVTSYKKQIKQKFVPLLTFNLKVRFTFSVLSPSACFDANSNVSTHWKHAEGMSLRYGVIVLGSLMRFFYQEFILSSVFFRRETASGFYP